LFGDSTDPADVELFIIDIVTCTLLEVRVRRRNNLQVPIDVWRSGEDCGFQQLTGVFKHLTTFD
jgi:hypothetical protein